MSARSLNRVTLIGNLTRDPEIRYTPSGTAVCTFGLATNRSWTPSDGSDPQEETEYHRIVAWSKLAEICSQLLSKGQKTYCEGRIQTRKWTGQDGNQRTTTEIVIDNMIVLSSPKGGYSNYNNENEGYESPESEEASTDKPSSKDSKKESSSTKSESSADEEVDVDDIPF